MTSQTTSNDQIHLQPTRKTNFLVYQRKIWANQKVYRNRNQKKKLTEGNQVTIARYEEDKLNKNPMNSMNFDFDWEIVKITLDIWTELCKLPQKLMMDVTVLKTNFGIGQNFTHFTNWSITPSKVCLRMLNNFELPSKQILCRGFLRERKSKLYLGIVSAYENILHLKVKISKMSNRIKKIKWKIPK